MYHDARSKDMLRDVESNHSLALAMSATDGPDALQNILDVKTETLSLRTKRGDAFVHAQARDAEVNADR